MDIRNIINRLQDVDKLKLVLLDEKQRQIFDNLPKPGIMGNSQAPIKSFLTMEMINKSKKNKIRRQSNIKYQFLFNGDPINQRMLDMLSPSFKNEMKLLTHETSIFNSFFFS